MIKSAAYTGCLILLLFVSIFVGIKYHIISDKMMPWTSFSVLATLNLILNSWVGYYIHKNPKSLVIKILASTVIRIIFTLMTILVIVSIFEPPTKPFLFFCLTLYCIFLFFEVFIFAKMLKSKN